MPEYLTFDSLLHFVISESVYSSKHLPGYHYVVTSSYTWILAVVDFHTHFSTRNSNGIQSEVCVCSDFLIWMKCTISATRATHKVWVFVLRWVDSHISACLVFLTQQWEMKWWKNLDLTSSCTVIPLYNNGKLQCQRAERLHTIQQPFLKPDVYLCSIHVLSELS